MRPFHFIRALSVQAAVEAAAAGPHRFLAGGTNLVDLMKFGVETPSTIIDISGIPLDEIEVGADGSVHVGALARNSDMAYHPLLRARYPVLSEAILAGASPQLRNAATLGGNLMQRTRCPYFYDTVFQCNKRDINSGCSAIPGYNRSHAILGTSDMCIATHPSDMCVALAALGAVVDLASMAGARHVPLVDFHTLPGEAPQVETVLQPGELITGVTIPNISFGKFSHYLKVRDRASYEFALTSAAVALDMQQGVIREARIALGGVGTKPWRCREAEIALAGALVEAAAFSQAAETALLGARPHDHNFFKVELAKRTLTRALQTVGAMT